MPPLFPTPFARRCAMVFQGSKGSRMEDFRLVMPAAQFTLPRKSKRIGTQEDNRSNSETNHVTETHTHGH
jgi:hypothetical protein